MNEVVSECMDCVLLPWAQPCQCSHSLRSMEELQSLLPGSEAQGEMAKPSLLFCVGMLMVYVENAHHSSPHSYPQSSYYCPTDCSYQD